MFVRRDDDRGTPAEGAVITSAKMTAAELLAMPDDGFRYELVQGELRRMSPAGLEHSAVAVALGSELRSFVRPRRLGIVGGADSGYRLAADTVRAPDVSFIARDRLPAEGLPVGYWDGAPDLAAEVVSPYDRIAEMDGKVADHLAHGARLVWVINPRTRTLTVHAPGRRPRLLTEQDEMDGEDVVPGFRLRLGELFAW